MIIRVLAWIFRILFFKMQPQLECSHSVTINLHFAPETQQNDSFNSFAYFILNISLAILFVYMIQSIEFQDEQQIELEVHG